MSLEPIITSPLWGRSANRWLTLLKPAWEKTMTHFPLDYKQGEISVVLADDAAIQPLNASYRGKDKPTNVLSFPQQEMHEGRFLKDKPLPPSLLWGDIILAHETIAREAHEQGKTFDHHFTHLFIHGFLHLLGYDHERPEEGERMEALERGILEALGIKDPYHMI